MTLNSRRLIQVVDWFPSTIVSGGQTGTDRAALDWAVDHGIDHGIDHGGWCPRGRVATDGAIPSSYRLRETESAGYRQRTRLNVQDSDATLIFNLGELDGGTQQTARIAQNIGARAFIVAPKELATEEWVKHATRHCHDWTVRYVNDGKVSDPIEILSVTDELSVVADEITTKSGFDLKLTESVEDLLWLALALEVEAKYYFVEGTQLSNPDSSLIKRGVPERVAARQTRRAAFTRQLKEIRLENDFGSSGLWGADGKMLPYDLLDLPFSIVRRIAAWQRDYDDTMNPPYMGDDAWWNRHEQDALNNAVSLQDALGSDVTVKLYQVEGWQPVDQIAILQRREP